MGSILQMRSTLNEVEKEMDNYKREIENLKRRYKIDVDKLNNEVKFLKEKNNKLNLEIIKRNDFLRKERELNQERNRFLGLYDKICPEIDNTNEST